MVRAGMLGEVVHEMCDVRTSILGKPHCSYREVVWLGPGSGVPLEFLTRDISIRTIC